MGVQCKAKAWVKQLHSCCQKKDHGKPITTTAQCRLWLKPIVRGPDMNRSTGKRLLKYWRSWKGQDNAIAMARPWEPWFGGIALRPICFMEPGEFILLHSRFSVLAHWQDRVTLNFSIIDFTWQKKIIGRAMKARDDMGNSCPFHGLMTKGKLW